MVNETWQIILSCMPAVAGIMLFILMDVLKYVSLKHTKTVETYVSVEREIFPGIVLYLCGLAFLIYGLTIPSNWVKTLVMFVLLCIYVPLNVVLHRKKKRLYYTLVQCQLYDTIIERIEQGIKAGNEKLKYLLDKVRDIDSASFGLTLYEAMRYKLIKEGQTLTNLELDLNNQTEQEQFDELFEMLVQYFQAQDRTETVTDDLTYFNMELDRLSAEKDKLKELLEKGELDDPDEIRERYEIYSQELADLKDKVSNYDIASKLTGEEEK